MKCANCGFDSDKNFCPMCGSKMPDENMFNYSNPYDEQKTQAQTAPAQQPVLNQAEPFVQNTEPVQPAQPSAPPFYGTPQPGFNSAAAPEPEQNMYPVPMQPQVHPKRKNYKALSVTLTSIIALIAVAGIAINIVSAFEGRSITESLNDGTDDDYTDYTYVYGYIYDVSQTVDMTCTSLKIKDFKIQDFTQKEKENYGDTYPLESSYCLNVTFEIENIGEGEEEYCLGSEIELHPEDADYVYFPYLEILDGENDWEPEYVTLAPGEKKEVSMDFAVSANADSLIFVFNHWGTAYYDTIENDYCALRLDLTNIFTTE